MTLALYDRVQQTGTANTTVSFTLSGSVAGYQSFVAVGNGNTTYYGSFDTSGNWEVGLGTYSTTGPTLTRTTILSSSNGGLAVTFSGTVNVFITYPSEKSVNQDANGNVGIGTSSPATRLNVQNTRSDTVGTGYLTYTDSGTSGKWTQRVSTSNAYAFDYYNGSAWSETMRIDPSGNLLVGTTGNYAKLSVLNPTGISAYFANSTYADQYLKFTEGTGYTVEANYGLTFNVNTLNAAYPMKFSMGGTERMRIDSSGNVSVGATASTTNAIFEVASANKTQAGGTGQLQLYSNNSMAADLGGQLVFGAAYTGTSTTTMAGISGRKENGTTGDVSGYMAFWTNRSAVGAVERMRIGSSGNVGIGTNTPTTLLELKASTPIITLNPAGYTNQYLTTLGTETGSDAYLIFGNNSKNEIRAGRTAAGGFLDFYTNNTVAQSSVSDGILAMRLDSSGNLLVNTTSVLSSGAKLNVVGAATSSASVIKMGTDGYPAIDFRNSAGAQQGYVQTNASTVLYVSVSDYRLKENIAPMKGALSKVQALKPCIYTWKNNNSSGQGFIAHELQAVVPDCVTGEKDAVNEDGSIKPQGIDVSFLVATLSAAIQEQQALIESLTTRLTVLEAK